MIEYIKLLRNIGQFDSVDSDKKAIAFGKLTLVYAENGRGKTTLANILRSLAANDPTLINERSRLGAQYTPHVVICANGQSHIFQNGAWSSPLADLAVFDDNFVAQNVCSGIEIDAGHKQNLHELILGAQGVALSATLKIHISKVEEHNRLLKSKEAAIPVAERGNLTVDQFCDLPINTNLDAEIQAAERNLTAAREVEQINKQAIFQPIDLPIFDIEAIENILQKDLPGLQATATATVRQHFTKLGGKDAETWIGEGLRKIPAASMDEDGDVCPFCTQELQNSSIIAHYEAYFSEEYTTLKQVITDYGKAVSAAHNEETQSAFERTVSLAIQSGDFWRKFTEVPTIAIDTAEIARAWKAAREPILAILRAKFASPLERMTLTSEIHNAVTAYNAHREAVVGTSQILLDCNKPIAEIKAKATTANVAALSAESTKLKMTKARHSPVIAPLCQAYVEEKNAKKETEALRDNVRKNLEQYRSGIFVKYEQAINRYLEKFNAGFRLGRVAAQNHKAGSSCTYEVVINEIPVKLTADSGPSFKNTLSAGDRNALALAFFFASLDQDPALAQKIVVIDDPMTSLDEHRSLATIREVRDLVSRVKQVVVLSHSKPFLCQIWEGADKVARSALHIIRSGQSSSIDVWDVHQDCITEHDKRYALIKDYIEKGNPAGKEREVAVALRYVLEAFLRVSYPPHFPPGRLLRQFAHECEQALAKGTTILSQPDRAELCDLTVYANKFHHDTNPAYASVQINDQELLGYCKRTLQFAQRG